MNGIGGFFKHLFCKPSRKQYDRIAAAKFWRQEQPTGNDPYGYLKPIGRSRFLYKFMPKLNKDAAILEIGCNVGRNLNYLFGKGYRNLYGIEINPHAIVVGKKHFQKLFEKAHIYIGEAQGEIDKLPDGGLDLIYSMVVFQHIPDDSNELFSKVAKKVKKYLLTLEDETHFTQRHFPRNYQKVFGKLGLRQIKSTPDIPGKEYEFKGFMARLFEKVDVNKLI